MPNSSHVQTKSAQSLSESRDLFLIQMSNPTSSNITDYRTAIDPALILSKLLPSNLRLLDLSDEQISTWLSYYGTGISEAEILYKISLLKDDMRQVIVGDGPWINDIGPVVDIPPLDSDDKSSISDKWHKNVVTDLADCDVVIASALEVPDLTWFAMLNSVRKSQFILFPVSSRHIVKTSDGHLHAVTSYDIDGLSRIIYLTSANGGESWSSQIIDNDDGCNYVLPSITCDKSNNIHITYTRWDIVTGDTFWLFCGKDIPDGFELESGSGGIAYHRLLCGGEGAYWPVGDPDVNGKHYHDMLLGDGSCSCKNGSSYYAYANRSSCGWHHSTIDADDGGALGIPPSKTLKLLRYHGIPPTLPIDIIIPFDTASLPSGFSRYTAQDNYPIYMSDSVGVSTGAVEHDHNIVVTLSGAGAMTRHEGGFNYYTPSIYHTHTGDDDNPPVTNDVPKYGVVLGKITSPRQNIPQHSILMCDSNGVLISGFTDISSVGSTLYRKFLIGYASYSNRGGTVVHYHDSIYIYTSRCDDYAANIHTIADSSVATHDHYHAISVEFLESEYYPPFFAPRMYHVDSDFDTSVSGNDLFYRRVNGDGSLETPVNVSLRYHAYPAYEGVCLADIVDDLHFIWSSPGINATHNRGRICYKKMTSGVLGSVEYPSTDDVHCVYPSIDIDLNGDVHVAWSEFSTIDIATAATKVRYCKRTSAWGSAETVDNSNYVGFPSNIITDFDCNPRVMYCNWADPLTLISNVYTNKRTSSGWGTPVVLSPDMAASGYDQFPGQIYLDNKGNVVFTWTGEGYGAHPTVYHPVYRYISPDGTMVPSAAASAVDLFPDDDNAIIYPAVFWHSNPLIDAVRHNLVTSGISFLYLYDIRGGDYDVADLKFFSSPDALVGDVGSIGAGGSGDGDFTPGGISVESILKSEVFSTVVRGHIGRASFSPAFGGYLG